MRPWDHRRILKILCPACGADRLIPLTFAIYRREAGPEVEYRRPMAKCSGCGQRMFANITARQPHRTTPLPWNEG